jgi:hypothetical protein
MHHTSRMTKNIVTKASAMMEGAESEQQDDVEELQHVDSEPDPADCALAECGWERRRTETRDNATDTDDRVEMTKEWTGLAVISLCSRREQM